MQKTSCCEAMVTSGLWCAILREDVCVKNLVNT